MSTASTLEFALAYASASWHVFPLQPRGKKPLVPGGFKAASVDSEQISAWWTKWPDANIGIATGAVSGLVVIDLDGNEGNNAFRALMAERGGLPRASMVRTGKGAHLYFALPSGSGEVKCSAGGGLDVRADGGYVVAPQSIHPSGRAYEWQPGGPEELPVAPAWLIDFAKNRKGDGSKANDRPRGRVKGAASGRSLVRQLGRSLAAPDPYSEVAETRLRSALAVLDASDRDTWVRVGMALHDLAQNDPTWAEPARGLFDNWSATCPQKFSPEAQDKAWASFSGDSHGPPVTVASIFFDAKEAGWIDPLGALTAFAPSTVPWARVPAIEAAPGVDFSKYLRTDAGNALAFVALFGGDLRFVEKWGSWLVWERTRWGEMSDLAVLPLARRCTEEMLSWSAARPSGDNDREAWIKHALASQKEGRLRSMVNLAKGETSVRVEPAQLDRDPMLLGCPNGTLDLRTGALREARREDLITKQVAVPFDPKAECPRWLAFLDWAMQGNSAAVAFLQRLAGYALTGEVREELMPVLVGNGANGKSTFVMTLRELMRDYAGKAQSDLLVHGQGKEGAASPDVAALQGKRLVIISETEDGCMLSEARIKDIVSNEGIAARRLHRDPFEFSPTHKIILATNHRPKVRGTDNGIWRRIVIVVFEATLGEAEKLADFREKILRPELAGILRWAVDGCSLWAREGLCPPAMVRNATAAYRSEMDTVAQWLEERTEKDATATTPFMSLYSDYVNWAQEERVSPLGRRRFGDELERLGSAPHKGAAGARVRHGIKLRSLGLSGTRPARTPTTVLPEPTAGACAVAIESKSRGAPRAQWREWRD